MKVKRKLQYLGMEITMSNRKERVKKRLAERRKFYDAVARLNLLQFKSEQARRKLKPNTFRATFSFSPEEMGLDCNPQPTLIEKLGLKRALERTHRQDFFTNIDLIVQGTPTKETLTRVRTEVLENTKKRFSSEGVLDLASFKTTAGESDEVNERPTITTEP